jgi:hypothetical protein
MLGEHFCQGGTTESAANGDHIVIGLHQVAPVFLLFVKLTIAGCRSKVEVLLRFGGNSTIRALLMPLPNRVAARKPPKRLGDLLLLLQRLHEVARG